MKENYYRYVLITPARNEEEFIELTLKSMVQQTLRPVRWVIVSDGSTDRTDEIVRRYAVEHKWIELLRMPERKERHFGGKVLCFKAGWERVKNLKYEIIGNLDADMTFEPGLFEFLMGNFAKNHQWQKIFVVVFVLYVAFFAWMNIKRNGDWKTAIIFYEKLEKTSTRLLMTR